MITPYSPPFWAGWTVLIAFCLVHPNATSCMYWTTLIAQHGEPPAHQGIGHATRASGPRSAPTKTSSSRGGGSAITSS
eukprot:345807-Chlamydomonas_euryale.AAC.1